MRIAVFILSTVFLACGVPPAESDGLVVEGQVVSDPANLGLVALRVSLTEQRGICSGTLVAPRFVLTAAHCLQTPVGAVTRAVFAADALSAQTSQIRQVVGSFRSGSLDIAMLQLDSPAPESYKLMPLASGPGDREAVLAGFGRTDRQDATSTGLAHSTRARIAFFEEVASFFHVRAYSGGACFGDSGGPALVSESGRRALLGVLSTGSPDCTGYDQYISVVNLRSWVREVIAGAD